MNRRNVELNLATKYQRVDGRRPDELRPCRIVRKFLKPPPGAVLIECGETRVVCTATVVPQVPEFLRGREEGWLTAEYGMLPGSTPGRKSRERDGRASEIQRLIGRCLRAIVDRSRWSEHTVYLDCDVLQADGGTRTAAITGSYVALVDAMRWMEAQELLRGWPILDGVAAVSVGLIGKAPILDLNYEEDSKVEVDMNVAMTGTGRFIEVQGTGERGVFTERQLGQLLRLARGGIRQLLDAQKKALERP
ncbi:MAG: ribonuclease PH [Planctomycetes bacterium]|nr:ribonuclease PH [Planctomycetota bacterium]